MITENYVSFETAKLLKEKGFYQDFFEPLIPVWHYNGARMVLSFTNESSYPAKWEEWYSAPTLQMAMKWLREVHKIVLVVDYEYECDFTSYYYKIYKLGEYGRPESVAVTGVSYDEDNNPTEHIVGFRDYSRGRCEYATYEEACEEGIKHCLENLI